MAREAGAHLPVMLESVMEALRRAAGGVYVDCTFGRGGHTRALLSALGPSARVIALDRDPEAVAAGQRLASGDTRLEVVQTCFSQLEAVASRLEVSGQVNGVLLDLGVSSPQLEDASRGFSFMHDGPLDMRMDPGSGDSAAGWLERAGADEIADVLYRFGDERHSRRIARAIVSARREAPIRTTRRLADIVQGAMPRPRRSRSGAGKHPATRTFQALRIFINRELDELQAGLSQSVSVLAPAGRLVAISFHSLEDRMVKRFMRNLSRPGPDRGAPGAGSEPVLDVVGRPLRPGDEEVRANPRARSAVMRVAEKRP